MLAAWYDLRDIGNAVGALLDQIRDWGAPDWVPYVTSSVIGILGILLWTILSVLAFIWIERRVVGLMQNRIGPNRVGPQGILQPAADGLKNIFKEETLPPFADKGLFLLAPMLAVVQLALLVHWADRHSCSQEKLPPAVQNGGMVSS